MPLNTYNKTTWINDQEPSIDEDHLNNIEDGIDTNRNALITLQSQVGSFSVARNVLADEYTNSQIDTLISSATGLPSGGTANQVLAKNTSTDYDAEWKTMSASNTTYSNTSSGLSATTVQGAIDEVDSTVDSLSSDVSAITTNVSTITTRVNTLNARYNTQLSSPDLNEITYNYHGYVTSATNIPSGVGTSGELIVNANSTGKYVMQIYSQYNGANVYTRSCNNGTWTAWTKMVVASDLEKQIISWQRVNMSYTDQVADKATATLTGTMTAVSGATDYILIAERINFGFFTSNPTRSGTTISCTGMNVSGASHTLSGSVVVIAIK